MRVIFATIFCAWPISLLIRLLALIRNPLIWTAGLCGEAAKFKVCNWYAKTGIMLFFWSVWAVRGKDEAQMAVMKLMIGFIHGD